MLTEGRRGRKDLPDAKGLRGLCELRKGRRGASRRDFPLSLLTCGCCCCGRGGPVCGRAKASTDRSCSPSGSTVPSLSPGNAARVKAACSHSITARRRKETSDIRVKAYCGHHEPHHPSNHPRRPAPRAGVWWSDVGGTLCTMKLWAPPEPDTPPRGIDAAMARLEKASQRAIFNPISCFLGTACLFICPWGAGRG